MASTDQRTGFRFGWGSSKGDSDKSSEHARESEHAGASDPAASGEAGAQPAHDAGSVRDQAQWPTSDVGTGAPGSGPAPDSQASGFLSELMRAMQAAADQTRKQVMDRFRDEARMHVDGIRSRSGEDLNELRRVTDADVASIREWSKAEIARIKTETDERIAARRAQLESQVEGHGALVDREVEKFQAQVSAFEQQMDGFFARLQQVGDPSTFAAVAQGMPEPPQIETLGVNARSEALAEAPLHAAPRPADSAAYAAPTTADSAAYATPTPAESTAWGTSTPDDPVTSAAGATWSGGERTSSAESSAESPWAGGPASATIDDWSGGSRSLDASTPTGGAGFDSWASPPPASSESAGSSGSSWTEAPASSWSESPSPGGTAGGEATGTASAWESQSTRDAGFSHQPAGDNGSSGTDSIIYGAPASLAAEALSGWGQSQQSAAGQTSGQTASNPMTSGQPTTDQWSAPSPPSTHESSPSSDSRSDAAQAWAPPEETFSADGRLAALGLTAQQSGAAEAEAESAARATALGGSAFDQAGSSTTTSQPSPTSDAFPAPMAGPGVGATQSAPAEIPGQSFGTDEPVPSAESSAARLAGLVPSSELPANGRTHNAQPIPTQVIVTGLLSVASIAAFKRHLSRIPGVQGVGVSSGPDGEFIFKTTHEPGVALAALIPALPGFGAEIVSSGEGTIQVAAHDPEADA